MFAWKSGKRDFTYKLLLWSINVPIVAPTKHPQDDSICWWFVNWKCLNILRANTLTTPNQLKAQSKPRTYALRLLWATAEYSSIVWFSVISISSVVRCGFLQRNFAVNWKLFILSAARYLTRVLTVLSKYFICVTKQQDDISLELKSAWFMIG